MVDLILCEYTPPMKPGDIIDDSTSHGPRALLNAGLIPALSWAGAAVTDVALLPEGPTPEPTSVRHRMVNQTTQLATRIEMSVIQGLFPIVLGDCTTAIAVVAGMKRRWHDVAVVWIDAHGDLNTEESSLSGYLGGMPLAAVMGESLVWLGKAAGLLDPCPQHRVALAAARGLDPYERDFLAGSRVMQVTAADLNDPASRPAALDRVIEGVVNPAEAVYIHLDVDSIDPGVMPSVSFPCPDGLTLDAVSALVEKVSSTCQVRAMTVASFNPYARDARRSAAALASMTAGLASRCARSRAGT